MLQSRLLTLRHAFTEWYKWFVSFSEPPDLETALSELILVLRRSGFAITDSRKREK